VADERKGEQRKQERERREDEEQREPTVASGADRGDA
jgi:hypothetical protein